jgi:hypothetical protein
MWNGHQHSNSFIIHIHKRVRIWKDKGDYDHNTAGHVFFRSLYYSFHHYLRRKLAAVMYLLFRDSNNRFNDGLFLY